MRPPTESEDEVRVVRSAKDKAWDEMKDKVGKINNALKINDWTIVEGEFDELSKRIEAKKVSERASERGRRERGKVLLKAQERE
jgi:hypothetical protein